MPRRISTVRGREFGAGVRAAIDATGMSLRHVAKLLGWDLAKVSTLVNGKIGGANARSPSTSTNTQFGCRSEGVM